MISFIDLSMHYGKKTLFEKSSLTFDPHKKYGLVGANGAGKSTLLRLIIGIETPSSGSISIPRDLKLGVLNQDHFRFENEVIYGIHIHVKRRARGGNERRPVPVVVFRV